MRFNNLILAATLLVFASSGFARPDASSAGKGKGHHREQVMEQFEALNLSAEQKSEIKQVFKASRAERKALSRDKRELFKQMHQGDVEKLTPEQIDRLSAEYGRVSAAGMKQKLSTKISNRQQLTYDLSLLTKQQLSMHLI